jgi:molecular chaperone GrpE
VNVEINKENDERIVDIRAASQMRDDDEAGEAGDRATAGATAEPVDELTQAKELADSHYKNWQRTAADFQNYKRRVEQERSETARFAHAALVINMLPVFDDLDRAVATVDAHLAGLTWVQGIVAIHRKFANLLQAMDVKEITAEGETFDPSKHEAVSQAPGEEGKVLHVVQKGYQLGERVVRPAMVIVGSAG